MQIGLKISKPYKVRNYKTIGNAADSFVIKIMQITKEGEASTYSAHLDFGNAEVISLPNCNFRYRCTLDQIEENVANYQLYLQKIKDRLKKWNRSSYDAED